MQNYIGINSQLFRVLNSTPNEIILFNPITNTSFQCSFNGECWFIGSTQVSPIPFSITIKGRVRVGKYNYKTQKEPSTEGYTNVLIHTSGELSPYTMRDSNGTIMENAWQFSKLWEQVPAQRQPVSMYQSDQIRWEHPAELHYLNGQLTDEYWNWKAKGFAHSKWVRYPAGFHNHKKCLGSVYVTNGKYSILDYITARKLIYVPKYKEIAITTNQFQLLKQMIESGQNIQINEVDGPTFEEIYPYNQVVNASIEVNPETLYYLLNSEKQAFGHGYTLAGCLLGFL
ncbi:MAG: hypothetical protein Solivirus1_35 [Solivirus sp.]|uniref:Uncharacterized protein n=1 Tax=Solivirus sp. TaxID=2487772 RepID=A0A3G5AFG8_9VIRU|nr:MAG: hypothetical protein Solivirus1_35 [Solivirus sp.]